MANFDGSAMQGPFARRAIFGYDSWRTASNWSVDWSWWRKTPQEQALSDRIQGLFWTQGLDKYVDQYSLDGKPLSTRHSTGLVATNAVASLAAVNPRRIEFVDALWNTPVPSGEQRYYDGMLYMMSMMHIGGAY